MMQLTADQWVNVVGSSIAALSCAVFGLVYGLQAPWWRSTLGRNVMLLAGAIGGLCLYTVLITLWPTGCAAIVLRSLRTAVLLAIAVLMIQRTRLVIIAQRATRPTVQEEPCPPPAP
ncbi:MULTISPECIES: hypothetical protein [unclassified Streptomyces]|uniref:putative phage holin n=1 Tax=unclassified Streptomyces TaxID=2593676 RepID=UPI00226D7CA6|nr:MULTISPECIES: hypothetical protein [unclassified Streptomyces]MCY0919593.1 hypothetical protein [Streptomyces sp. H27-G5]MCY0959655.1 hypothetical protein [Streptomyces sp. H27-H5]